MVDYTYITRIPDGVMRKKLTITVAEDVYEGLREVIGPRHISMFLETLARPHVVFADLDAAYADMSTDEAREREALEWAESSVSDVAGSLGDGDEAR